MTLAYMGKAPTAVSDDAVSVDLGALQSTFSQGDILIGYFIFFDGEGRVFDTNSTFYGWQRLGNVSKDNYVTIAAYKYVVTQNNKNAYDIYFYNGVQGVSGNAYAPIISSIYYFKSTGYADISNIDARLVTNNSDTGTSQYKALLPNVPYKTDDVVVDIAAFIANPGNVYEWGTEIDGSWTGEALGTPEGTQPVQRTSATNGNSRWHWTGISRAQAGVLTGTRLTTSMGSTRAKCTIQITDQGLQPISSGGGDGGSIDEDLPTGTLATSALTGAISSSPIITSAQDQNGNPVSLADALSEFNTQKIAIGFGVNGTNVLNVTGLSFSEIPDTATIIGFAVFDGKGSMNFNTGGASGSTTTNVRLILNGVTVTKVVNSAWPLYTGQAGVETSRYGTGFTDLWGLTGVTPAVLKAGPFTLRYESSHPNVANSYDLLDYVALKVYYTAGGGGDPEPEPEPVLSSSQVIWIS